LDKEGDIDSDKISQDLQKICARPSKTIREVIKSCQKEGSPALIGDIALAVGQYNITRKSLTAIFSSET